MQYREETPHPSRRHSLRAGEMPQHLTGDPRAEKRDMSDEQRAAFRSPHQGADRRVRADESDQGRTR